jgi:LemA protein
MNQGLIVLLVVIAIIVIWAVSVRNRLARYRVTIDESKENVDIALAKRYDTIAEMAKVAKTYARHEEKILVEMTELRQGASLQDTNRAMASQDQQLRQIFAVAESYPELLSSQQFLRLEDEIDQENEQLAAAKRIVNSNIRIFNQQIVAFPASIIAKNHGFAQLPFLKEEGVDRKRSLEDISYDPDED